MRTTIKARFAIKNWEEKAFSEGPDLPKLTRATVSKTLTGGLEGEGHVEYLMMYRPDGTATVMGLERVTGRIGDRRGSFVLKRIGEFEGGLAKESYEVVPGSGTGGLKNIRGGGRSSVGHGMEHPFEMDVELE